ncbi:hypothetical protein QVA66_00545 [Staphylococcus chromogenes]|nr:hypothetical protein [Staphylococcus chromogenes]
MDYRANVYSPLQNMAIWLGAWIFGHVPTDECLAALTELGGSHRIYGQNPDSKGATLDFLKFIRSVVGAEPHVTATDEPLVRLILAGPGEAPRVPAGSLAATAIIDGQQGALEVRGSEHAIVLVPELDSLGCRWRFFEFVDPLPAPAYLSPGDADLLLADATRDAAQLIEGLAPSSRAQALPNPRLTVGSLSDFYDVPGLPLHTPPRAAKLFARADRVAAILETVSHHAGDHSFDPQLLPLWRHIRAARMAGVDYALREFSLKSY